MGGGGWWVAGWWGGHLATYLRLSLGHSPRPSVILSTAGMRKGKRRYLTGPVRPGFTFREEDKSTCGLLARGR